MGSIHDAAPLLAVREWDLDEDTTTEVWVTGYAWWSADALETHVVSVTDAQGEDLRWLLRRDHKAAWPHEALADEWERTQARAAGKDAPEADLLPFVPVGVGR